MASGVILLKSQIFQIVFGNIRNDSSLEHVPVALFLDDDIGFSVLFENKCLKHVYSVQGRPDCDPFWVQKKYAVSSEGVYRSKFDNFVRLWTHLARNEFRWKRFFFYEIWGLQSRISEPTTFWMVIWLKFFHQYAHRNLFAKVSNKLTPMTNQWISIVFNTCYLQAPSIFFWW